VHVDPDLAVEMFILEPDVAERAPSELAGAN
jgi:hypothetical protein